MGLDYANWRAKFFEESDKQINIPIIDLARVADVVILDGTVWLNVEPRNVSIALPQLPLYEHISVTEMLGPPRVDSDVIVILSDGTPASGRCMRAWDTFYNDADNWDFRYSDIGAITL